ncbi:uncharacterized protein LOC111017499 isoform X2 [Momordica charantia]|uniref:Uncharacterized protein LOC111017499 isoform X2 n=1 Tax=Momordica charantia TaxID=3673 RepID=A0A6J1D5L5_MOMCH|nr:uncharacterized protein LOC111017499 isoform X2 [Momordica charantia]
MVGVLDVVFLHNLNKGRKICLDSRCTPNWWNHFNLGVASDCFISSLFLVIRFNSRDLLMHILQLTLTRGDLHPGYVEENSICGQPC